MIYNIVLTYSSFIIFIIFLLVYIPREKINNLRTKLYKAFLILCGLYSLTEIILIAECQTLNNPILTKIIWLTHWAICNICFNEFFLYSMFIGYQMKVEKFIDLVKYNWLTIFISSVTILQIILDIFVYPNDEFNINNIDFIHPSAAIFCSICAVLYVLYFFNKKNNMLKDEKIGIIFAAVMYSFFMGSQIIIKDYSFIPIGYIVTAFCLYFNSENPDLGLLKASSKEKEKIELSNKAKTDFLINMTDEIRVPMGLIKSVSNELNSLENYDADKVNNLLNEMNISSNNMLDIIDNILNISEIESGNKLLKERNYQIKDMLVDIINIAKEKIGSKNIKLIVNIDSSVSSILYGDSSKLYQSILNVVTNAIKYTDVGKITFTLTSSKLNNSEELLFKVADSGNGIKEEDKDKVFTKSFDSANSVKNSTGFGLSVTKEYIDSMNGKIWFESEYRVGSTFYIQVMQKIIDSTPIGQIDFESINNTQKEYKDFSKYRVLIVDDNELNIKVTKKFLERYNLKVEYVTNGKDCIYNIKSNEKYDLIFMDLAMSSLDGMQTFQILNKLVGYSIPPVVALTANAIVGMKEMYLSNGFSDYLSKPLNPNELEHIIYKYLQ